MTVVKAECPACSSKVGVSKPKMGQRVRCSGCDADLEVVWLEPLELDWPYDEDEDEEYGEEYDEEELY